MIISCIHMMLAFKSRKIWIKNFIFLYEFLLKFLGKLLVSVEKTFVKLFKYIFRNNERSSFNPVGERC